MRFCAGLWLAILWVFGGVSDAFGDEENADRVFVYTERGGRMTAPAVEMSSTRQGDCVVTMQSREGERVGKVRLSKSDLQTFEKLVSKAGLRHSNYKAPPPRMHSGEATLRIRRDREWVEVKVAGDGPSSEVVQWLRRVAFEAELLLDLGEGKSLYRAKTALKRPGRILHPAAFQPPLTKLLMERNEIRDLRVIVSALSYASSPEQWSRILDTRLKSDDKTKVDILVKVLGNHPFPGNANPSHRTALLALLLRTLQREYRDGPRLPYERRLAASALISQLGNAQYKPAVPVLVSRIDRYSTLERPWVSGALAKMGVDAIDPLARLLRSPNPAVRLAAAGTVERMLSHNPRALDWSSTLQDEILKQLREQISAQLQALARSDPEPRVQKAAAKTAKLIEHGGTLRVTRRR